jgi:hypothetical protein
MNEVLTIDEIRARYPSEHVLLEDPQTNEHQQVVGGRVLWHGKDREEVYHKAVELRPRHSAFVFTGPTPEHVVFVL